MSTFNGTCRMHAPLRNTAKGKEKYARVGKKIEVAQDLVAPPEMKKMLKNMTIPELERAKNYCVATGNKAQAIIYLEQIIILATDQNMLKDVRLELADLYFDQGSISKASKMYASYLGLYPGSEDRAYVHYEQFYADFMKRTVLTVIKLPPKKP